MRARFVTLVNQKGGVGKTTTAVSLAAALGRRGEKVLLIDLDPQANATSALGVDGVDRRGIYDALLDEVSIEDCIVHVPEEKLDLVPSSRELSGAEVELVWAAQSRRSGTPSHPPIRTRSAPRLRQRPPRARRTKCRACCAS